jgi:hypothetical protein
MLRCESRKIIHEKKGNITNGRPFKGKFNNRKRYLVLIEVNKKQKRILLSRGRIVKAATQPSEIENQKQIVQIEKNDIGYKKEGITTD